MHVLHPATASATKALLAKYAMRRWTFRRAVCSAASGQCALVHFVWGMEARPDRELLSGRPLTASLDLAQPLLSAASQLLMVELCDFLSTSPPWRVRQGSLRCPMAEVRKEREAAGMEWPVQSGAELESVLAELAVSKPWLNQLVGVREGRIVWLAVQVRSNVLSEGAPQDLLAAADWFEGVSLAHNARGEGLSGWQTSAAWIWMEALDEAVGGTAGCLLAGRC